MLLELQPVGQDHLVERRGADRPPGLGDRTEPLLRKIGDEAQHPGVPGQAQQVGDAAQQLHPVVGRLLRTVPVDQEGAYLLGGELLDAQHPAGRQQVDPLPQCGHHLAVRLEVLRAGGHDDLGLVLGRLQQHGEVVCGPLVSDPGDELVEAVEEEHDPALPEHVVERLEIDQLLAVVGQMSRDQPGDRVRLVEVPQLDQQGGEVGELTGDPAGELPHREGLAPAGVAEEQDEPAVVAGEQPHQLPGEVVADRAVGPAELAEPEPLRHIQLGRVAPIGVQPPGLLGHVVRQVEQDRKSVV